MKAAAEGNMGSATVVSTGGLEGAGALRAKGLNLQKSEDINCESKGFVRLHHLSSHQAKKTAIVVTFKAHQHSKSIVSNRKLLSDSDPKEQTFLTFHET